LNGRFIGLLAKAPSFQRIPHCHPGDVVDEQPVFEWCIETDPQPPLEDGWRESGLQQGGALKPWLAAVGP
jgi:hypothetical protein